MVPLAVIRVQMTKKNQSAFEVHGQKFFMIVAIVTFVAVEVIFWTLFGTNIYLNVNYYPSLKYIGVIFANISIFSLMIMASGLNYPKTDGAYVALILLTFNMPLICTLFITCLRHHHSPSALAYLGAVLVSLSFVLVLFVHKNLNWLVYSVICLSIVTEIVSIVITKCKSINEEQKVHNLEDDEQDINNNNLEAQQVIQQENNDVDNNNQ